MSNKQAVWETILALPGPRVVIGPWRIHHGRVGLWLFVAGVFLMLHDVRDFPWRLRER